MSEKNIESLIAKSHCLVEVCIADNAKAIVNVSEIINDLMRENERLRKQNTNLIEAFKKPHEWQINQLKYDIAIEFESEIKKLRKAYETALEALEFVGGVDSVASWKSRLHEIKKDSLIECMINDITACHVAIKKCKEILSTENKNTSEFVD